MSKPLLPEAAAKFWKLSNYSSDEVSPNKSRHKVTSSTNVGTGDEDYYSQNTQVTDLNTGDTTSTKTTEIDGKANESFSSTDSSGNITMGETSGDNFSDTKLFKPKTWFQSSENVSGTDAEGYEATKKRKVFGLEFGGNKSKSVSEEKADEIIMAKNEQLDKQMSERTAGYEKHELLDNEDPESWEYDENGKPTELKEAKAVKKLNKEYKLEAPTKCGQFIDKLATGVTVDNIGSEAFEAVKFYMANKEQLDAYADTPGPDKDPQQIEMINNIRTYVANEGLTQTPIFVQQNIPQTRGERFVRGAAAAGLPSAALTGALNIGSGIGKALKGAAIAGGIGTGLGYLLQKPERTVNVPVGEAFIKGASKTDNIWDLYGELAKKQEKSSK